MPTDQDLLLASVFRLGEAYFGIPTAQIQEIAHVGTVTPVHRAPFFVAGIRNLRGRIVTVIDLKAKLDLGSAVRTPQTRVMMIESSGELLGLLVDAVEDTILLDVENIASAPQVDGVDANQFRGIYRFHDRLFALLDHDAVFRTKVQANSLACVS